MARRLLAGAGVLAFLASDAWCQSKPRSETASQPMITVVLPTVDQFYKDAKLVFDLAGDQKGYQTFKETIDVFLIGVETDKRGGIRIYSTPDGLRTVGSLPIRSEAEFKKFTENLYDLDVKTAPPPKPSLAPQVPKAVQSKMKSLKLDSHERMVFGLYDGFLKYESGELEFGNSLEDVRLGKAGTAFEMTKGAGLTVRMDGKSQSSEQRRQALGKTREEMLQKLEKWEGETDAEFSHRKAITEQVLADLGNLLAEASEARIDWVTSHEKKNAQFAVDMKADTGSPLAKRIERTGHTPDQFAGVSKEGCVAWATINMPLDERRQESIKFVSKHSRAGAKDLVKDSDASDSRKSTLMDLSDLVSEVADDVANTSEFNGCLRIWSNNGGTLTSMGAVRVSDMSPVIEFLQKLKGQNTEGRTVKLKVAHVDGVDIHEVASPQSHKDYPELFDDEGAIYIGTGEKTVWYAVGKGGLDRLKESISEAGKGTTKSGPGELEARLLPLAEVWNKIHARRDTHAKSATVEKTKDKVRENRPKAAHAASVVRELNLSKLAVDAFQKGHDTLSMRLSAEGQTLKVAGQLDEGVLRFIGNALSQFVKDNLEN